MNWVTIQYDHINLDLILAFFWKNGKLVIIEPTGADTYDDPDKVWYNDLCSRLNLFPADRGAK